MHKNFLVMSLCLHELIVMLLYVFMYIVDSSIKPVTYIALL